MLFERVILRFVRGAVKRRVFSRPDCHPGFDGPENIDRPSPSIIGTVLVGYPHTTIAFAPFGVGGFSSSVDRSVNAMSRV